MQRLSLIGVVFAVGLIFFAGCELHLQDRDGQRSRGDSPSYGYCDETGCYECDEERCWRVGEPGDECDRHADCPAGCYCDDDGTCQEGGFCREHADCPRGFACDDRASCVPKGGDGKDGGGGESGRCEANDDCPLGSYCDGDTGSCFDSDTCRSRDCQVGYVCDDRDTCVPETCSAHDDCSTGSYCDSESQTCVPTELCEDGECPAEGYECDFTRDTCVPETEHPGSCDGEILCEDEPPACSEGETPLIRDGCYTGECLEVERCDVPPRLRCEGADETQCIEADHCRDVYAGFDCTTDDGAACQPGDSGCYCERFEFDRCEAR